MAQVDRLRHLDRELLEIAMQCEVALLQPHEINDPSVMTIPAALAIAELLPCNNNRTNSHKSGSSRYSSLGGNIDAIPGIPLRLTFFAFESGCKLDVVLAVWPLHIQLRSVLVHFAMNRRDVAEVETEVKDLIEGILKNAASVHGPLLKRIVTAVNSLISHSAQLN